MKREEAKPLQAAAQHAADWLLGKIEMKAGGFGKEHEHLDSERAALHVVHSIAVVELARLKKIVDG